MARRALRRLAVVGGGAAGVELALAAAEAFAAPAARWRSRSSRHPAGCSPAMPKVRGGACCAAWPRPASRSTWLAPGHARGPGAGRRAGTRRQRLPADCVIAATGAHAPPWTQSSGLACDAAGWVAVDAGHRSVSHPFIHAAGDVVPPRTPGFARSGVHAVHAGPVLAANLLAVDGMAAKVRPQLPAAPAFAVPDRNRSAPRHRLVGTLVRRGRWVWHWKDYLDRGFIARHRRALPSCRCKNPRSSCDKARKLPFSPPYSPGPAMHELVQDYYGHTLQSSADLRTSACCDASARRRRHSGRCSGASTPKCSRATTAAAW